MDTKTDVLVVGAGPVGLTMASEMARYGLSVRIIDKNTERTDKSKALVPLATNARADGPHGRRLNTALYRRRLQRFGGQHCVGT